MIPIRREDVPFAKIDFTNTRLKFRRNFKDEEIKKKAESISKAGLVNPVKLWKQGDRYIVIAGWQRIAAVISLGRNSIAADVYEGITFEDAVRISIADNHLREDLSDYETACQMRALSQYENYPAEKIAELFGCGVDRVYDLLSIFNMEAQLREAVERGDLALYRAVVISRFPASERSEVLRKTLREGRSVKWLRRELAQLKLHPFISMPAVKAGANVKIHALRFPKNTETQDIWRAHWEIIGRQYGVPAPMRCEAAMTIQAQDCHPPYVCQSDIEWVVLAYGRFPHGDTHDWNWEEVPLDKRDGWFFLCSRCARLMFPEIVFHNDVFYSPGREELMTNDQEEVIV